MATFKAIRIDKAEKGQSVALVDFDEKDLMDGDVTVKVAWSTINYKDGLALTGKAPVVRRFPMIPGIDLAGTVEASTDAAWKPGDQVILDGFGLGETHLGSYAEKARVKGDWLVPLPAGMSGRDAMAIGTAGYTAMLAVMALEAQGLMPKSGEVLVTGAAGGVGSVATAILAKRGYQVVASTGRSDTHDYLKSLGATTIIDRSGFSDSAKRPLEGERWAACIDSVGGNTLARVLAQTKYGGTVAAVGLAGGSKLDHTVIPFLLRGVSLLGIDSVMCPMPRRLEAWNRLQSDLPLDQLEAIMVNARLDEVPRLATEILKGQVRGRVVVDVNR